MVKNMADFSIRLAIKKILIKLISPKTYWRLIEISKKKKRGTKIEVDTTLQLYSKIFPGDFLHFGYFENDQCSPEEMSLKDIEKAQHSYAELLINEIKDKKSQILDVGCGMGGLISLLLKEGYSPVALSPDHFQVDYVSNKYPDIEVIESSFEHMPFKTYKNHFGTVITAESIQYLELKSSLPVLDFILKRGGNWIIGDYFEIKSSSISSGIFWDEFCKTIDESGWEIIKQEDITLNVLPFLEYCYMWVKRLFLPLMEHIIENIRITKPGIHYLLEDIAEPVKTGLLKRADYVNPTVFSQNRRYMLLVLKRKG